MKKIKFVETQYLEKGCFQGGDEDSFNADMSADDVCICMKKEVFEQLIKENKDLQKLADDRMKQCIELEEDGANEYAKYNALKREYKDLAKRCGIIIIE